LEKIVVLMMAYGGPDSLDNIEPYLLDVRGGRKTSQELVEEIRHRYAAIGGCSPLLEITNRQAQALEKVLNQYHDLPVNKVFEVKVGMRHWHPYIRDVVKQIFLDPPDQLIAFCMTPYESKLSTQAYFRQLNSALAEAGEEGERLVEVTRITSWYDQPKFIRAVKEKIEQALLQFPEVISQHGRILFSAHSLPAALVQQGDPYEDQIRMAIKAVVEQMGLSDQQWRFCFQSAGASNDRWLGPSIEQEIEHLAMNGVKHILSVPIGFVCDHVEVLYDIDIETRQFANSLGIRLERTGSLNDSPTFINALADLILKEGKLEQR
jgi:protoporphyrin/coproporphyrin ferrochelatase